ncbi:MULTISPECIES: hypothetical protein [Microcoleaceae]|nr:hypothetical protein [Tychonema sp. LEGE 06208]
MFCVYSAIVPEERVQYASGDDRTLNKKMLFATHQMLPFAFIFWL